MIQAKIRHKDIHHQQNGGAQASPFACQKTPDPFYKTARWKKLRARILRRDGYMCQYMKRYGRRIEAEIVHHIFPRREFPEYAWKEWNLISVSAAAHNKLEDRQSGQLTAAGAELLRRTAIRQGIEIPERYA